MKIISKIIIDQDHSKFIKIEIKLNDFQLVLLMIKR